MRDIVSRLFAAHSEGLQKRGVVDHDGMDMISGSLKRIERYWTDQIRYIY